MEWETRVGMKEVTSHFAPMQVGPQQVHPEIDSSPKGIYQLAPSADQFTPDLMVALCQKTWEWTQMVILPINVPQ